MGEVETDAEGGFAGLVVAGYRAMGGLLAPNDQRLTGDDGDPGVSGRRCTIAEFGQGAPLAARA